MQYTVIKTNRKTITLSVGDDLVPVVRAPYYTGAEKIDQFVRANEKWLEKAVEKKKAQLKRYDIGDEQLKNLIVRSKEYIPQRVKYYSKIMNLQPTGIKITTAKKRFGSCSGKNSLCFSCYLMLYPENAIDYVVVHELAHIKYHNHSDEFYHLIEQYLPDYKQREKLLK